MIISSGIQHYPANHAFTRDARFPYWTVELTRSGRMQRRSRAQRRFRRQPNDTLILVPPDCPYQLRGEQSGREVWIIFRPRTELLPYLDWPIGDLDLPALALGPDPALAELAETVHAQAQDPRPELRLLAVNSLERLILEAHVTLTPATPGAVDPRIRQAIGLMRRALDAPPSVAELAAAVHLSISRFAHLFRELTGATPMQYLETLRLEQAEHLLLRTDLTVKEVAARTGFEDAAYFSTRFRRRHGRPPSRWRRLPTQVRLHPGTST